jgi:hypothetical protein
MRGVLQVAPETQRADIRKVALATSLGNGKDVVGIPETSALPVQIQLEGEGLSFSGRNQLQAAIKFQCIQPADGADAVIPAQNHLPQIPRIGSQPPFVHTMIPAKRPVAGRHLTIAPPADTPAVGASIRRPANPAPGFHPVGAHSYFCGKSFRI